MQVAAWSKSHYGREGNQSFTGLLCAGRGVVVVCVCAHFLQHPKLDLTSRPLHKLLPLPATLLP